MTHTMGLAGQRTSTGFLLPFFMHGLQLDIIELTLDEGNPKRIDWMDRPTIVKQVMTHYPLFTRSL